LLGYQVPCFWCTLQDYDVAPSFAASFSLAFFAFAFRCAFWLSIPYLEVSGGVV
jgi:hypothetical protein